MSRVRFEADRPRRSRARDTRRTRVVRQVERERRSGRDRVRLRDRRQQLAVPALARRRVADSREHGPEQRCAVALSERLVEGRGVPSRRVVRGRDDAVCDIERASCRVAERVSRVADDDVERVESVDKRGEPLWLRVGSRRVPTRNDRHARGTGSDRVAARRPPGDHVPNSDVRGVNPESVRERQGGEVTIDAQDAVAGIGEDESEGSDRRGLPVPRVLLVTATDLFIAVRLGVPDGRIYIRVSDYQK